jgi:erythromycin esterase-like protein
MTPPPTTAMHDASLTALLRNAAQPLESARDYDALLDRVGTASLVLLGGASHRTD